MFFHAAAQNNYYNSSVFIKGGSQTLSDQLVSIIENNGGSIIYNAMVEKIIVENSLAKEVIWKEKKREDLQKASASTIIANCSPHAVYNKMLPARYKKRALDSMLNTSSLYTIYIIFKKAFISLFPNNSYSTFIRTEEDISAPLCSFKAEKDYDVKERGFVFVDYSAIDSGLVKEGDERSFAVLTGISYYSDWDKLSEKEYKNKKEEMAQYLFEKMEKYYPGFKENIEYYEISTPKTIQRYLKTPEGTAYGFAQNRFLQKSRISRQSKEIKNLFFASAWTFPGGGFTGALISGYATALEIIKPIKYRLLSRILLCTAIGILVGTFIAGLIDIFF